jgi:hypothetical protein
VAEHQRPRPTNLVRPAIDLNMSWLLQQLTSERQTRFRIARGDPKRCCTPRRNPEVEDAFRFFGELSAWSDSVSNYWRGPWMGTQADHGLPLASASNVSAVFVPVVPLFEKGHAQKGEAKSEQKGGADSKALVLTGQSVVELFTCWSALTTLTHFRSAVRMCCTVRSLVLCASLLFAD